MKRRLLLLLVILFVGAWVGEKMVQDPGYVLVAYDNTTVETSLWVLLVVALVGFLLAHLALNLLARARIPTAQLRHWNERRALRNAHRKTLKGLNALADGHWWKAQRYLGQAAPHAELPLVNYLAAARAAHEQGDEKGADDLLEQARSQAPDASMAIELAQAQLQFERGQYDACRKTLEPLRQRSPKHTQLLRLQQDCLVQLSDWQALSELLPELRKQKALPEVRLNELEHRCYSELLQRDLQLPAETEDATRLQALNKTWQSLPTRLNGDEPLVCQYVAQLAALGGEDRAEPVLREQINRNWSDALVNLYGRLKSEQPHKQLESAKKWLKDHPDNAELLLALGRLSMRNEHWGKAVDYFEQSIAQRPSAEAYGELCRLLQHLGEHDRVLGLLQAGIEASSSGLPSLPLPRAEIAQNA
ncbi:heme biosynthesis protein HemY [Marinobacterium aestuariivivens]|uniref:Heme biosynthesis protein HemY n=1 Tax=Marinobacterium aestuariivivens TaxID=1698799 RepID=A0ABW2A0H9_9GAMM